jgi:hypothetical protein
VGLRQTGPGAREATSATHYSERRTGPNSEALFQLLKAAGSTHSLHLEIKTDHPFSDHRIAQERDIIVWLNDQGI